jgi:tRNA-specific 2-thiouridylase
MAKVLVGMSGGVDSSVAAYLLRQQRHEVVGVSLLLIETRGRVHPRSCCTIEAIEDARETAHYIGIEHFTVEARAEFIDKVIEPFVQGYLKGITPNPCILCNLYIKFPYLLKEADRIGADFIATGHYARVEETPEGYLLKKGIDPHKDQSYFLYVLKKETLARILFPLGGYRKEEVRRIAAQVGLPAFKRPESVEICFVGGSYSRFIAEVVPESRVPGPIVGPEGKIIGRHQGIFNFTIGQRKGLGVAYGEPLYVVNIEPETHTVYLGRRDALYRREVVVEELNWLSTPLERVTAKVRSTMLDRPATLRLQDGSKRVQLLFDEPQWAPAPGQSAVFYNGDVVIGGGIIR